MSGNNIEETKKSEKIKAKNEESEDSIQETGESKENSAETKESESNTKKPEGDEEEIKLSTPGFDPRFPNTNQTARCFAAYVDYHRCLRVLGEGDEANYFKRIFTSLCPKDWIKKWDEQREAGTFPRRIDRVRLEAEKIDEGGTNDSSKNIKKSNSSSSEEKDTLIMDKDKTKTDGFGPKEEPRIEF